MKIFKPFGPSIGKSKISRKFLEKLNMEVDTKIFSKSNDYSPKLASQIRKEVQISKNFIKKYLEKELIKNIKIFLMKENVKKIKEIKILNLWVVSQYKNEYNPIHFHKNCNISAVMYIKIPTMLPSRKKHRSDDGAIVFLGNSSRETELSMPTVECPPEVGDFFIFGANQQHAVYPFRCAKGETNTERRSISFNAYFKNKQ